MSPQDKFLEPLLRLKTALDGLDPRASEILALHAAIERELDWALMRALPKANRLYGLGFGHKISVWAAAQRHDDKILDQLIGVLLRFNELRNSVAHGDNRQKVDAAVRRLIGALPEDAPHKEKAEVGYAAAFVFGALNAKGAALSKIHVDDEG
jgi:hypothetical protein